MRRARGFTLIEMLAVVLLMAIVVSAATSFYLQLSRESNEAAEGTRRDRRATAVLDRLARELEGAVLVVKPRGVDPLDHPWLFLGEHEGRGAGSDRLKFVTRAHRPRAAAESDLAVISYSLAEDDEGVSRLLRTLAPRLPESLDRSVPTREEDGAEVLLEDVASFGVRFLSEEGQWKDSWDSSSLADAGRLPVAAEIELALAPPPEAGAEEPEVVPEPLRREVVLAVRPLDLETLLKPADQRREDEEKEEDGEEDAEGEQGADDETSPDAEEEKKKRETACITVIQCISSHPEVDVATALDAAGLPRSLLVSVGAQCASDFATIVPLPPDCL